MVSVKELTVSSPTRDALDIRWKIEDTNEDLLLIDFFVQRSEGQVGPFEDIAGPIVDTFVYRFQDIQAPQYYRGRQFIYRLRMKNRSTGEEGFSEVTQILPQQDLIAKEIERLEVIRMMEYSGRRVLILQRRTFGQRCPNCWDQGKTRIRRTNCSECFDTGFARGYLQPLITFAEIETNVGHLGLAEQQTELGQKQHNIVSARIISFPLVTAGDLIIEAEHTIWRVVGLSNYQHIRSVVAQQLALFQVPETDIEYRIPLSGIDFATFQAAPRRAQTNYANIDAATEGIRRSVA